MSVVAIGVVVGVAGTAYGAISAKQAAKKAAQVDNATAAYNARIDVSQAEQLDLDTQANIRTERQEDQTYLSREDASYAAAGVLSNTGSAMDAQITNAGRMEQKIQQEWINSNQQQQKYYSAAAVGQLEGGARASADNSAGDLSLVNGGIRVASTLISAYDRGAFKGGGASSSTSGDGFDEGG